MILPLNRLSKKSLGTFVKTFESFVVKYKSIPRRITKVNTKVHKVYLRENLRENL